MGEGEGECVKIVLVENSSLDALVSVFLELTNYFSIPAGAVVLIASGSYMAADVVGFVWVCNVVWEAFTNST